MSLNFTNSNFTGILIEELYTANKVFINNKIISSVGIVNKEESRTLMEKKSVLKPINTNSSHLDLVIQISNHELISGQFEKNIYIGSYDSLSDFNNKRLSLKYFGVTFYISISLFLYGLYRKNKKYTHHLTLSIAGFFNFYVLLTHYEPMVIFNPKGLLYLYNSYLSPFPTLFAQFFCAMTVILFFGHGFINKHKKNFILYNCYAFLFVIFIIIVFDDIANPIYIATLIYIMLYMIYSLYIAGLNFTKGITGSFRIFIGLSTYIVSYSYLIHMALIINPHQTMNYYSIYMILGQILFYLLMSYVSVSKFSSNFYLTEIEEEKLEFLVKSKTNELEKSYKELLTQDDIRKKMLQDISHDLRSPITVVKGYAELMTTNQIPESEKNKYIEIIFHKISYVSNLISELFALNGLENDKNYPMDVECISDILINTILSYNKSKIETHIEKDLYFYCNEKQMYRLFNNLIDNALEYSKANDKIIISLKKHESYLIIKITDFGVGIEEEDIKNIFNRFTRSDKSRNHDQNHFGLGLSISKAIVNNHKGSITCTSKINYGTTFTIQLPANNEEE